MEVKIQIPDNCELIKDGNTYIVREKKQTPPKSWEEFCKRYPVKIGEAYINSCGELLSARINSSSREDKNWCASKEEAEAFLALMQLRQLRKAWVGDWKISERESYAVIYACCDNLRVDINTTSRRSLSFPTKLMAEDFLNCFKDLCETAKILL